jgi:hypothetical protein
MPPLIGAKCTRGIQVDVAGVDVCHERVAMWGADAGIGDNSWMGTGQREPLVICGTNHGMLFLVQCECYQGVSRRGRLVVGLDAAMMAGALVTHVSGVGMDGVGTFLPTLWVTLCSGAGVWATLRGLPRGSSHACTGLVHVQLFSAVCVPAIFFLIRVRTRICLSWSISLIVVTNLSITSCKCSFYMKKGTWQC